jgi:hypothetical protein
MSQANEKKLAGEAAIRYVEDGAIVGVGTGSTVAFFIDALAGIRHRIAGTVSSSEQSTQRLRSHGIEVLELNHTGPLGLYVDGADECDPFKRLIKGGGAALTREKIVAAASEKFVCIIDSSKRVDLLARVDDTDELVAGLGNDLLASEGRAAALDQAFARVALVGTIHVERESSGLVELNDLDTMPAQAHATVLGTGNGAFDPMLDARERVNEVSDRRTGADAHDHAVFDVIDGFLGGESLGFGHEGLQMVENAEFRGSGFSRELVRS